MRSIQLATLGMCTISGMCTILGMCTLCLGTVTAQENEAPKAPPAKIDYSILGQPGPATKVGLLDEQRAAIAEILDTRVNDLVAAEPKDREAIVNESNQQIEALLSDAQKEILAKSLQGGKLQFNFFKQKWSAVLKWFAEQANLSLVMDTEPPGLFTYNDTREFTPSEAIDLLNSVLLSKNFTLIRRERMLVVVDTSTGVPYDLVQQVPLEKLSDFGRFEIVTTEFPLGGRPLAAVVEAVTPLVGTHGQVIPLAAADKLLVTETAGRLKAINVVISAVPVPEKPVPPPKPPIPPVFKTYPAPGLDPQATTEILTTLFPAATIKFDPIASVVHCNAVAEIQAGVEASLNKLVESVSGDNRPRLKAYKVSAKQLATLIDQVTLAHPTLAVDSDPDNNRLLVVANVADHAEVAKTLESLGVTKAVETSDSPSAELVIYPIDAESVAIATSLLEEILPGATVISDVNRIAVRGSEADQRIAKNTIGQFAKSVTDQPSLSFYPLEDRLDDQMMAVLKEAVPEATINWLSESKQLSVLATLRDHQRVSQTLAQVKEAGATPKPKTIAYYPVSAQQKSRFQLIQSELPGELSTMLLMTEAMPDEFIAWGTESQHKQFAALLDALRRNEPTPVAAPKKLDVTIAAPGDLIASLQSRFPGVEMVFNEYADAIYVWAEGEKFESIRQAFQTISATMAPRQEPVMIPYALENADADSVLTLLMGMRPELNAAADARSNRILVSAPLSEQSRYKVLIEQLDMQPNQPNEPQIESYGLKSIDASTAVSILTPLFPELTFSSDPANQRLIATGTAANQVRLSAAIERIDVPKAEQELRLETYALESADASQVISVLTQLVPTAIASSSADGKQLIVWGNEAAHQTIKQAMVHLTSPDPRTSRSMKTYRLPKGAAPSAVSIMQPVVEDASLSLDVNNENLIAWATEAEHQAIESAVAGLRQGLKDPAAKTTEVYRFGKSSPAVAYSVLTTLVPGATMAIDSSASVLVATASADDHAKIKAVIARLDSDPDISRSMKAYPIPRGAGATAVSIMQPVADGASLSLDTTNENLIVWGTVQEHQAIAKAVEGLRSDLVNGNDKSTEVYRFLNSTPQAAYTVLTTLIPDATMAVDETTSVLVATASADQHEMIRTVVAQIEDDPESARKMKAYPLPRSAAATAVTIMQPVAADATFSLDQTEKNLIVWATDAEHEAVAAAVESLRRDLVNRNGDDQTVAVYALDPELISAQSLVDSFDQAVTDQLSVLPNAQTNSLIVHGTKQAQARFAETIDTIRSQLKKTKELQTQVYRFTKATPAVALEALTALLPDATFAIDEQTSVLVATATARQHESIATVVKQIDTEESKGDQTTRVYRLHRASADTVSDAFRMLAPKARIGFDAGSNVVIATAGSEDHAILKDAVAQVEGRARGGAVKVFRLTRVQANVAATAVQAVIDSQSIEADVQASEEDNSLVVVAAAEQMKKLEAAIGQIDSDNRRFDVFEIVNNDPFQAERSARDMFNSMPERARPHIGMDFNGGKLFVHGTQDQVEQVRTLLTKMGEPLVDRQKEQASRNKRTIRFRGDSDQAIEQVKMIWPRLRGNPIQVIVPSSRAIQPIVPGGPLPELESRPSIPDEDSQSAVPRSDAQIKNVSTNYISDERSITARTVNHDGNGSRLVVFQNTTRAPKADDSEADKGDDEQGADQQTPDQKLKQDLSPILMVADGDNITIASDDIEALDRLESLLNAIAGEHRQHHQSDFAIFLLRNTGASDTKELLVELIDELPFHVRGGISDVVVVADDRLNALVVYGNRQAREMVGQLLEVLDSQGLPDPLNVYKSEIFQFKHIHVSRAMAILRNVYKPQLSPGMGKKPIEIPEGVTTSVASILTQINASNRGPILTLDMDATTNSMIMRAPPELREEICKFATELDERGANNSNRSVRVIQLRQGKSELIREALEQFIGNQPISPSSGAVPSPAAASAAAP